jgi:hypothetical protein
LRLAWAGAPRRLGHRLRGLRRSEPEDFRRLDLSDADFDALPPSWRRVWLASQNLRDESGPDHDKAYRLLDRLDALHAGHCACALDPHAKEWM